MPFEETAGRRRWPGCEAWPLLHPEQWQAVSSLRVPPRLPEPIHTQPGNAQEAAACLPGSRMTCCAGRDPARGLILKAQSRAVLELLPS